MKKLLCILLAIMCLCLVGCNDTPTAETPPCEHQFVFASTTATCTEDGEENWTCSLCNETKKEFVEKIGHKYRKNGCERCSYAVFNVRELVNQQKEYLYSELKKIATPFTYEDVMQVKETLQPIREQRQRLTSIIDIYDGSFYGPNQQMANEAKEALIPIEKEYREIHYELNEKCKGYGWTLLFEKFEEGDTGNYGLYWDCVVEAYLLFYEIWGDLPTWSSTLIVNEIKEIIGIDIIRYRDLK